MIARTPETFRDKQNIDARTLHEVEAIDLDRRRVRVRQLESTRVEWEAFDQLLVGLRGITAAGYAHGDLSAYNLLWWEGRLIFIDFPQAVDVAANPAGLEFLHRDVTNVCDWFTSRGLHVDAEEVFADALSFL